VFEVNLQARELRKTRRAAGAAKSLARPAFAILAMLLERAGEVINAREMRRGCGRPDGRDVRRF